MACNSTHAHTHEGCYVTLRKGREHLQDVGEEGDIMVLREARHHSIGGCLESLVPIP